MNLSVDNLIEAEEILILALPLVVDARDGCLQALHLALEELLFDEGLEALLAQLNFHRLYIFLKL